MKHTLTHDLAPDVARKVAAKAFASYSEKYPSYSPKIDWRNDDRADVSFKAKGITLKGEIALEPGKISFDLDVPFVLRVFKGKAVEVMDRELQKWVAKAKAGELD